MTFFDSIHMNVENPYHFPAGKELDSIIHLTILGKMLDDDPPRYSTDKKQSEKLLGVMKYRFKGTIRTGRAQSHRRIFFARHESTTRRFHEVLAESQELAVCRLAVLLNEHQY